MKIRCFAALVLLVLSGCGPFTTLAQTVRQGAPLQFGGTAEDLRDVTVLGLRDWPQEADQQVAIFRAERASTDNAGPPQEMLGFIPVAQTAMGTWRVVGGGGGSSSTLDPATRIASAYFTQQTPKGKHTILYGRVGDAKVKYVEATFDNRVTLRDATTGAIFALVAVGAGAVCEVRLLDANQQVLHRKLENKCES